jgi:ferredoxin--NADP+ reductase
VVETIRQDEEAGMLGPEEKEGRLGFDRLAEERGLDVVTFRDWKKIEKAEEAAARDGAPREKFTAVEAMIRAKG